MARQLLQRTDSLPDSPQWLYELKLDGYRAIACKRGRSRPSVHADLLEGTLAQLTFDNGVTGVVDLAQLITYRGVFAPLRDPDVFKQMRLDPEPGTIVWPNGADIAPETLYRAVLENTGAVSSA